MTYPNAYAAALQYAHTDTTEAFVRHLTATPAFDLLGSPAVAAFADHLAEQGHPAGEVLRHWHGRLAETGRGYSNQQLQYMYPEEPQEALHATAHGVAGIYTAIKAGFESPVLQVNLRDGDVGHADTKWQHFSVDVPVPAARRIADLGDDQFRDASHALLDHVYGKHG